VLQNASLQNQEIAPASNKQ